MRRRWRVAIATLAFYGIGSAPAWAGATLSAPAAPSGHAVAATTPDGLGGLFAVPNLAGGAGKTLFEATSMNDYRIFTDLGLTDVTEKTAAVVYEGALALAMALVKLAIGLTWWLNALTSRDSGVEAIGTGLQQVSTELNTWLLPTALGVGAVVAYGIARAGRDALGQVLWTVGLGLGSVAMALSAPSILTGVDQVRQLLAQTVTGIGASQVSEQGVPFPWPGADLQTGDAVNDLARASGDAVWRNFAVTPWCQVQFGSQAACAAYAPTWLTLTTDDARTEYVDTTVKSAEGGADDAPTVRFIQGHEPAERIAASLFAVVTSIAAVVVIGGLALLALMPWVTALLLLTIVTVFLCLLAVPGRPRRIGLDFLNLIAGLVLLSALTTGILSGAELAIVAATGLAPTQGWLPVAIMTTAIMFAAWHARTILERILFVSDASGGRMGAVGLALGIAAVRRLMRGTRRVLPGRRAGPATAANSVGDGGGGSGPGPSSGRGPGGSGGPSSGGGPGRRRLAFYTKRAETTGGVSTVPAARGAGASTAVASPPGRPAVVVANGTPHQHGSRSARPLNGTARSGQSRTAPNANAALASPYAPQGRPARTSRPPRARTGHDLRYALPSPAPRTTPRTTPGAAAPRAVPRRATPREAPRRAVRGQRESWSRGQRLPRS